MRDVHLDRLPVASAERAHDDEHPRDRHIERLIVPHVNGAQDRVAERADGSQTLRRRANPPRCATAAAACRPPARRAGSARSASGTRPDPAPTYCLAARRATRSGGSSRPARIGPAAGSEPRRKSRSLAGRSATAPARIRPGGSRARRRVPPARTAPSWSAPCGPCRSAPTGDGHFLEPGTGDR